MLFKMDNMNQQDTCMICHEIITIPVIPAQTCNCTVICCLFCMRDYFELNKAPQYRHADRKRCMICHASLKPQASGSGLYTKLPRFFQQSLDNVHGEITCPKCNVWKGFRVNYEEHMRECPDVYVKCPKCYRYDLRKNHTRTCPCGVQYMRCDRHECKAPKCELCEDYLFKHETKNCPFCEEKECLFCPNGFSKHFKDCPKAFMGRVKQPDGQVKIMYTTPDDENLVHCPKCSLPIVDRESHEDICITMYALLSRLAK